RWWRRRRVSWCFHPFLILKSCSGFQLLRNWRRRSFHFRCLLRLRYHILDHLLLWFLLRRWWRRWWFLFLGLFNNYIVLNNFYQVRIYFLFSFRIHFLDFQDNKRGKC